MSITLSLANFDTVFVGTEALTVRGIYAYIEVIVIYRGEVHRLVPGHEFEVAPKIWIRPEPFRVLRRCRLTFTVPKGVDVLTEDHKLDN